MKILSWCFTLVILITFFFFPDTADWLYPDPRLSNHKEIPHLHVLVERKKPFDQFQYLTLREGYQSFGNAALKELFPDDGLFTNKTFVLVDFNPSPNAYATFRLLKFDNIVIKINIIIINTGLLGLIEDDENLLRLILAHEFWHLKDWSPVFPIWCVELIGEEETKIDSLAIQTLIDHGYNRCLAVALLERFLAYRRKQGLKLDIIMFSDDFLKRVEAVELKRIKNANNYCEPILAITH